MYPVTFSVCGTLKLKLKESMKYIMILNLAILFAKLPDAF